MSFGSLLFAEGGCFKAASDECARANPKNRLYTAGPFVNGPYDVRGDCQLS